MSEPQVFAVPEAWAERGVNADAYARMREAARTDPAAFFGEAGKRLDWIRPYTEVKDTSFDADGLSASAGSATGC